MENALPKNRPTRCESVQVNRIQFDHIFTDAAAAKGDEIAKSLATLKDDIAPAADKTFVMMKNKQVWFDRNNAALFPKFESGVLPVVRMCNHEAHNYLGLDFEGFHFVTMTVNEFCKSFTQGKGCPYLDQNGNYKFLSTNLTWYDWIAVEEISGGCTLIRHSNGSSDSWQNSSNYRAQLIPIHRLRGKNAAAMSYIESLFTWIKLGLIPEGLTAKQETFYKTFLEDYPTIEDYITADNTNIKFDGDRFKRDVLGGQFKAKVFNYDFDIRGTLEGVMNGSRKYTGSVEALKKNCLIATINAPIFSPMKSGKSPMLIAGIGNCSRTRRLIRRQFSSLKMKF